MLDRAIELADGDPTVGAGHHRRLPLRLLPRVQGGSSSTWASSTRRGSLIEQGRKLAREQGDIETVGWGHMWSTWLAYFAGEPEAALGHAQQSLEIAERIGDSFSRAWAWFWLGLAELMRGEWRQAIEALERSLAIARERRTAVEGDACASRCSARHTSASAIAERARALVEEGLEIAQRAGTPSDESGEPGAGADPARLGRPAARAEIEAALARALELARDTGAKAFEPLVHVELAELARQSGDEEGRERELREAHRLFTEIGATGHAERLAGELAAAPT